MLKRTLTALFAAALLAAPSASGAIIFNEEFDVDHTTNWSFNSGVASDTRNNAVNNEADYFFDYTTVGIPSAPHSTGGTRLGLKLQANINGTSVGNINGMSTSPIGQHFSGDYVLRFDAWGNFQAPLPGGGNGTTHFITAGVGSPETTPQIFSSTSGVLVAATIDGGTTVDYRAYSTPSTLAADNSGVYAAGTTGSPTNQNNTYYAGFTGSVPADQTTLFPTQTGSVNTGAIGFKWRYWEIYKVGNTLTWYIDGLKIATVNTSALTFGGDNIFVGIHDLNSNVSTDASSKQLLFGLIDNVTVDNTVPEPSSMMLLGVGAIALVRRRR